MAQSIRLWNATYSNVPGVELPKSTSGTATFYDVSGTTATASDVAAGKIFVDASGKETTGTNSGGGGGSEKNIQVNSNAASIRVNGYTATTITLTVAKTGTYKVSWMAWRSSSQGTMGTNLHVNSTAGTNRTTWSNTYGQHITLNNQSYSAGDVLTLYATSGSTSRYCWVGNLIIEEQ